MNMGFISGLIVTGVMVIILGYSLHLVALCTEITRSKSYQELVVKLLGKKMAIVSEIVLLLYLLGAIIAYMTVVGDMGPPVVEHFITSNWILSSKMFVIALFSLCFMFPLCLLKRVDILGPASFLAILSCLYLAGFITAEGIIQMKDIGLSKVSWEVWTFQFFAALPLIVFAFQAHILVPPVYAEYKNHSVKKMDFVIFFALILEILIYLPVAIFGYISFGSATNGDILLNYDVTNIPASIGRICVVLTVTLATPINMFPARLAFASLVFKGREMTNLLFYGITILLFTVCLIIALFVPGVSIVFSVIGATLGVVVIFGFPAAFAWTIRANAPNKITNYIFFVSAIIVGIIIAISGTSITLYNIIITKEEH